jgi:hypothetical protein
MEHEARPGLGLFVCTSIDSLAVLFGGCSKSGFTLDDADADPAWPAVDRKSKASSGKDDQNIIGISDLEHNSNDSGSDLDRCFAPKFEKRMTAAIVATKVRRAGFLRLDPPTVVKES